MKNRRCTNEGCILRTYGTRYCLLIISTNILLRWGNLNFGMTINQTIAVHFNAYIFFGAWIR